MKALASTVMLLALSGQAYAEQPSSSADASAKLEKAQVYRLYKAALVEWTADNCAPAISEDGAAKAKNILSDADPNAAKLFRALNTERAGLLRDRGDDPCDLAMRDVFTPIEQSKADVQARTKVQQARSRELRKATLIEWAANNCPAGVDAKTAAQAQETLKNYEPGEIRVHRLITSSGVHETTILGKDACKSVLNNISTL
ncbi:TPA: hypothetical protein SMN98_005565 [Pseudomonas aeruginosa]|uniref:hypothetical protein n=1 Tax=Pseudomonas aeruginosa TaxID=287 RepID=UPI0027D3CB18|nr:hypothetical protein [Pseudomonas aeruginosa]MDQ4223344.1 hypothetical protein [Pseudomonas aeruginosa]HBO1440268.1 hypothetical protein [Pseudomonas aeruginosa]HBP1972568.1 hypothetical protein [Pseudomonas aeruginosa]HCL3992424.1 hypothetical protein [Pseudomonas aeruginosa]HEJ9967853.1 hypothetical protein [Pseudomonas aeruginosa]